MESEQREAYFETLTIINNMETKYKDKIPKKLIEFFEKNKAENYNFNLDIDTPLKEQKLKKKTKTLLAILNLNFWCESEEEKQQLINKYKENEKIYYEELREKYNSDNIFKKHIQENKIEENIIQNEVALVQYKEPLFKRIINKIKNFFHIF